jgi:hypothetical protein
MEPRLEASLQDTVNAPEDTMLFTSPCRTSQPHVLYGDAHVVVESLPVEEVLEPAPTEDNEPLSTETHQKDPDEIIVSAEVKSYSIFEILSQGLDKELEARLDSRHNVNEIDNSIGVYPIHFVSTAGNLTLLKLLVERGNADIDVTNSENEVNNLKRALTNKLYSLSLM